MNKQELERYMKEIAESLRKAEVPISNHINPQITINKRARSRFAACRKEKAAKHFSYRIEVGEALLKADKEPIKNILAHELLHTCYGCYNHGMRWKQYADKLNRLYGYEIKVTATYEELGLEEPEKRRKIKYVIVCNNCGRQYYRQKKSRLVTCTNEYRCKCGGTLICYKAEE